MRGNTPKKPIFEVSPYLREYLNTHHRSVDVALNYRDMFHFKSSIACMDGAGEETMWETVFYDQSDREHIYDCLKQIYAELKADGDKGILEHLYIDRVDFFAMGNSQPFRVRIVNGINDLFDYFYIKQADASRIYGLELEHLLSPNNINFLVKGDTMVEEHIAGIPGDKFIANYLSKGINTMRLAKEFVKFNERCLVQVLGDMRPDNYVVEIIPDFDETYYRIRSIDFDKQAYEGYRSFYMPQFAKGNLPIVELGLKAMSKELEHQYRKEERSRIAKQVRANQKKVDELLAAMSMDTISTEKRVDQLKYELAELYADNEFITARNMGEIVKTSLKMVMKMPTRTTSSLEKTEEQTTA